MANDDKFTVTTTWQAVEAESVDITNGTFSVFGLADKRIEFLKTDTAPAQSDNGAAFINTRKDSLKYSLSPTENLYAKTGSGTQDIGVIPA